MKLLQSKFSVFLLFLNRITCFQDVCLDVDDILSPNLMPGTIIENVGVQERYQAKNRSEDVEVEGIDGSFSSALNTMTFHRSMMNQYLCRSYVANQILSDISKSSFEKRSSADFEIPDDQVVPKKKLNSNIMFDPGSSSYEEWLRKSSNFDDIYRHHRKINGLSDDVSSNKGDMENINHDSSAFTTYDGTPEMYYHVDATPHPFDNHEHAYFANPPYHYHSPRVEKRYRKSEKLADIFEIALTALTFLSFGMFIVHLIMSISAVTNNMTSTIGNRIFALNPAALSNAESYELDSEPTGTTLFESEERRSINDDSEMKKVDNTIVNRMAKNILNVMDSAWIAGKDNGSSMKNFLCHASRFSRYIVGRTKLFMGLSSFAMSWLSEHLSNNVVSRMEGLQATVLGLGLADCDKFFTKYQY